MNYSKRSSFVMFFLVAMIISWSITASTATIFEEDIPPAYYHYYPLGPGLFLFFDLGRNFEEVFFQDHFLQE